MAFESQSMKKEKKYNGVFGDMYSTVAIIPKDLELDKDPHPSPFQLHFQFPDLTQPIRVCSPKSPIFFTLLFNCSCWFLRNGLDIALLFISISLWVSEMGYDIKVVFFIVNCCLDFWEIGGTKEKINCSFYLCCRNYKACAFMWFRDS